jgi:hypothetical protein
MGANISLTFCWEGRIDDVSALHASISRHGVVLETTSPLAEGVSRSTWRWQVESEVLELTCRSYDRGAFVSTTIDADEDAFDRVSERLGRRVVVERFLRFAARLVRDLHLRYVFFEEEAEAEIEPSKYTGDVLFGITVFPQTAPWLQRALSSAEIIRTDRIDGTVVVYRRMDPAPHHVGS